MAAESCGACGRVLGPGVPICPYCGAATPGRTAAGRSRRRLYLLLAVLAAAVAAQRLIPVSRLAPESECRGGATATLVWKADDAKVPVMQASRLSPIDPTITPYIERAKLRHTGTPAYGEKNDKEATHLHEPVAAAVRSEGANAYFHHPSRRVGESLAETVTSAVVAHPGPVSRALRDRHFPADRVAMVVRVRPGSAAEAGGLRPNDLFVSVAGKSVPSDDPQRGIDLFGDVAPDGTAEVVVVRRNQLQTLTVRRRGNDMFAFWAVVAPIVELQ